MRFNFFVLINLAIVTTIGSSNLDLNSYLRHPLHDNCSFFVNETIKHFDSCQVSVMKPNIEFSEDALPYVCLLSLDVATELCTVPDRLNKLSQANKTESVCPMGYALKTRNLKIDITKGLEYMSDEKNCTTFCTFRENLHNMCQFIALANKVIKEEKSVAEHLDVTKGDEEQLHDFQLKKNKKYINLQLPIIQDTKLADKTKPKVSPGQLHKEIIQSVKNDKSDINNPVTKTESDKVTETSAAGLKNNLKDKRPDISIGNKNHDKIINDPNSFNKIGNKTVLKNDAFENNDNEKKKPSETDTLPVLQSNENTDIPGSKSPPLLSNYYSSNIQQHNVNINVNSNNNNDKIEYGDDSVLKTPHDEGEDDDDNNDEDLDKAALQDALPDREAQFAKSLNSKEIYNGDNFFQAEDSHFSIYFLTTVSIIIIGYVIYHNKKKILAYALEGRRNKNGRRRPTSASYRKLDCNLEEAIASNPSNTSVTNVVY